MKKRGQQFSLATVLIIVIGIITLVLVGLFVSGFFTGITRKAGQAPGQDLQIVAKSCELANSGNLKIDFCTFKEVKINGNTEYVNCEDSRVKQGSSWDLKCDNKGASYCSDSIKSSKWDKIKVNNKLCASFTCDDLGGTLKLLPVTSCGDNQEMFNTSDGNCCVSSSS